MAVASMSFRQTDFVRSRGEPEIVACLIRAAAETGVRADPISIINFYVAIKSTQLVILAGPVHSGKIALIQSLARVLTGGDSLRCQMMIGHAQWAGQTSNVALFAEAQTRLNTDKILALIEEAWQSESMNRVFMACLTRISQAELTGFFSEVAFQLRHGQIMRLPSAHLTEPIPYPPNLLLIGTMDDIRPNGLDVDLLSGASVISWPAVEAGSAANRSQTVALSDGESIFLRSCIRNEAAARLKLDYILGRRTQAIRPLLQLAEVFQQHAVPVSGAVMGKAIIYLANAWSNEGVGLFDRVSSHNFVIATDLAIAQTLVPSAREAIRHSTALHSQLKVAFNGRFPRSAALLEIPREQRTEAG